MNSDVHPVFVPHGKRPAWVRGVLASWVAVTRLGDYEDLDTPRRRSTDASRLTFPLGLLLVIVGGIVTTLGGMYAITYNIRSDVSTIRQWIDDQKSIDDSRNRLLEERFKTLTDAQQDLKRRMELQQYEVQRLNEAIAAIKKGS